MVNDAQDVGQLLQQMSSKKPDLVEFRLDNLHDGIFVETIAKKKTFPAVATDKSTKESTLRRKMLLQAVNAGFEFVDIDLSNPDAKSMVEEIKALGTQVIASFHDRRGTPSDSELSRVLESMKQTGADVCKIVTTAVHPRDNLTILDFLESHSQSTRLVSFAMGALGTPSRILSPLFGGEFTFASIDEKSATAEGQLSIDKLRTAWQLLGIQ